MESLKNNVEKIVQMREYTNRTVIETDTLVWRL